MTRAASKMVMLRSGGYDYAEVNLDRALHLVAGNNVGKTTLIAALQFLYIDNFSEMHFSHDARSTKEHYFPHEGSLVLFECMTPTGFQVLAFRGLGPVRGFDYERLIYAGTYDRSDYVDDGRVRPWNEVYPRLVERELRVGLTPSNVRAALTSSGDAKGPPLGLVPLARTAHYESFRYLFRNLITLTKIGQSKLKGLFIDIASPRLRHAKVDLRSDYAALFAQVERKASEIASLKTIEPMVRALVEQFARREKHRATLVFSWRALERALERRREENARNQEEALQLLDQLDAEVLALAAEEDVLVVDAGTLNGERGQVESERVRLHELERRVAGFSLPFADAQRDRLIAERDDRAARLRGANRADAAEVELEIAQRQQSIASDARLLERHTDAAATWLRANSGLPDDVLDDVFRVLNPALLAAVVGESEDEVSIETPEQLIATLRSIADGITPEGFAAAGVRIPVNALPAGAALAAYADIETVRHRLVQSRKRVDELLQLRRDVEERQNLERERGDRVRALAEVEAQIRDWEAWRVGEATLPATNARLAEIQREIARVQDSMKAIQERRTQAALEQQDIKQSAVAYENRLARVVGDVQRLRAPDEGWKAADQPEELPDDVEAIVEAYRRAWGEQVDAARQVGQFLGIVEQEAGPRYFAPSEAETIAALRDQLEALPENVKAVEELWMSIVTDLRSAFKGLLDGVDEVRSRVNELNRALRRRRISNLERVELQLETQSDLVRRLSDVVAATDAPLFADDEGRSRATRDVAGWLEDRPVIELVDLFDLSFRVVDRTGQSKKFESLSQIESHGTSTTIKVLVHLELMRSLLATEDVSIPFVLDEVATLDDANLRGLIDHARGMGFVPVVASPQASDTVDTVYFLRHGEGGLVLDESSRLQIERSDHAVA